MMTEDRPIGVDLYCGAGGMSLGFEQAGFNVVAAVDSDPIHVSTYSKNFPTCTVIREDLRELTGDEIRRRAGLQRSRIDVVFGGPPCQGFSTIGKGHPDDPRNLLLIHFARLVRELRPAYFVVENVEGLLSVRSEKFLQSFLDQLNDDYSVLPPEVLDAADFGVPQRRRRVFILGSFKDVRAVHPPDIDSRKGSGTPTVWDAIGDLPTVDRIDELLDSDVYCGDLGPALSRYARILRGDQLDPGDRSLERGNSGSGLTGCRRTAHGAATIERFAATNPGTYEPISRFYRLSRDGVAYTLRAGTDSSSGSYTAPRPIHPTHPRVITVREAARLHSVPDWFSFHPTKWHGFRQVGNSVPPLLARQAASAVAEVVLG